MSALTPSDLAAALRAAADCLDAIARDRSVNRIDWIDQAASPLGRKRHCAATRRRVAEGREGAAIVGRRHLLSPVALREVLEGPAVREPAVSGPRERLERELRLVGGRL